MLQVHFGVSLLAVETRALGIEMGSDLKPRGSDTFCVAAVIDISHVVTKFTRLFLFPIDESTAPGTVLPRP